MPLLFDDRDWCDVDSDEGYTIPELPPLPPVDLSYEAPVVKEEEVEFPRTVDPERFQFVFNKETVFENKRENLSGYVCFVGKFPSGTSARDLESFVSSKGIDFTEVRMGPKRKPNVNAFGYVDLPTKRDYELLLSFDGTEYRGRVIRVDHATRK